MKVKQIYLDAVAIFGLASLPVLAQTDLPRFKTEVKGAFVWGQDAPSGAFSSTIQDPLTGNSIHKLSYSGIEVSSRIGFERVGIDEPGTFLSHVASVINTTEEKLLVRYGGFSVDGHVASPLSVIRPGQKLNKSERKNRHELAELGKIHCFTSGFISGDTFFSASPSSQVVTVEPGKAVTISTLIRDPRLYHAILCSVQGCYPTGTLRFYLNVNSHDYVFVWSGQSAVYCGK